MGWFDTKWIVDFEYSDGFFSSFKKASMVVEASSEYSAKDKAKSILKANHKYARIISAHKSGGREDEKRDFYKPSYTSYSSPSNQSSPNEEATTSSIKSKPMTAKERSEANRRALEREKEEAEYRKQRKINLKKSEIAKENRRPTIVLIIGLLISGIAFLLGWAPYWVFNSKLQAVKDSITFLYNTGHDVNEPLMVELYEQGLQYKASRDSIIWLPFVILSFAIVATIVLTIIASKKKPARIVKLRRELEDLEK